MKNTYMQKKEEISRNWYVIDATDMTLGRLATKAATILRGKHKPTFTPHVDCGDYVIVVNASKVNLTGNKMDAYDIISRRDDIIEQNYFTKNFSDQYDVILTNPPYLKDTLKTTEGLADYILKALKEVKINGSVIMFLKTLHLESKVRYEKIFKNYPPSKLYIYADRISCYKNNDTSKPQGAISYSIFMWCNKKEDGTFDKDTKLDWIRYK